MVCKTLNADELYDSQGAKTFINQELFNKENIRVTFQNYQHPVYEQTYKPFIPYVSTLDLLFNCGNESLRILDSNSQNDFSAKDGSSKRVKS